MDINSFIEDCTQLLTKTFDKREATLLCKQVFSHVLGLSSTELILSEERTLEEAEITKIQRCIDKLLIKVPIQYVVGHAYFLDLKLEVNSEVLIPRPETEELVLWVSDFFIDFEKLTILDVCTGSGCIAIALKNRHPKWNVLASDISFQAIQTTVLNAKKYELKIDTFNHDILHHPLPDEWKKVEAIVSNPPYILEKEKSLMEENVLLYEPELALFVEDENPLLFYKKIIEVSMTLPNCKYCFFEINEFQAENLIELVESKNMQWLMKKDINEKNRMMMVKIKN